MPNVITGSASCAKMLIAADDQAPLLSLARGGWGGGGVLVFEPYRNLIQAPLAFMM